MSLVKRACSQRSGRCSSRTIQTRHALRIEPLENRIVPSCIRLIGLGDDSLPGGWQWVDPSRPFQNVTGVVRESEVSHTDFPTTHDSHDWNAAIRLDPDQDYLLSPANERDLVDGRGIIEAEWETGTRPDERSPGTGDHIFPKWAWPSPGDRVWLNGNWIYDCGHRTVIGGQDYYKTEIHPPRAIASMRDQFIPMPGTGTVPVEVTATDVFIHGDGGFATDVIHCGQMISLTGVRDLAGNHRCQIRTNPIADDFQFDIPLPEPRPTNALLTTRFEDRPGNNIPIDPILTPRLDQPHPAVHVTIPLRFSGIGDLGTYARRISVGWQAANSDLRHIRLTLNRMKLNEDHEGFLQGKCGCTFFFLNMPNVPRREWVRLVDYAVNPGHMNDFGKGEFEDFRGAAWDFYMPSTRYFGIHGNAFSQKSLDDEFGNHFPSGGDLLRMLWKYLIGKEDEEYKSLNANQAVGSYTWTAINNNDEYELYFTVGDIPLRPEERNIAAGFAVSSVTEGALTTVRVTAIDQFGVPAPGYRGTVHFTSTDAAATLPGDYTFTATDQGTHTWTDVVFRTAGIQGLTVTDRDYGSLVGTVFVTVLPEIANRFVFSGVVTLLPSGTPTDVTVTAKDRFGNTASGYRGTVHFTSTDPAATLPPDHTFTDADAGRYTWTNGLTLVTPGTPIVMVRDTVNQALIGSMAVTVLPEEAASLAIEGQPFFSAGVVGTFRVTARDRRGNIATNYRGTVHFTVSDGGASLPVDYTFTDSDAGVHAFTLILRTAGPQVIRVNDTNNSRLNASSEVVGFAAEAQFFLFADISSPLTAGLPSDLTVVPFDRYANVVTSYNGTVHFSSSDPSARLPRDVTFREPGIYRCYDCLTLFTAGIPTMTATDLGPTGISSQIFLAVVPAPASALNIAAPARVPAGTPFNVTVSARDAYGNPASDYVGTVTFTTSDDGALLPSDYTFTPEDRGSHTFSGVTLVTPGDQYVRVADSDRGLANVVAITVTTDSGGAAPVRGHTQMSESILFDDSTRSLCPMVPAPLRYRAEEAHPVPLPLQASSLDRFFSAKAWRNSRAVLWKLSPVAEEDDWQQMIVDTDATFEPTGPNN